MLVPSNREIDAWIAEHVMELPGVGYYRRISQHNTEWERCSPNDPDAFGGKASLYFLMMPNKMEPKYSVPYYTSDIEAAFSVIEHLRKKTYGFTITTSHSEAQDQYTVTIRGIRGMLDSIVTDLVTASDLHPAKAICLAVCSLYEFRRKQAEKVEEEIE